MSSSKGKIRVLQGNVTGVESEPISCFEDAMNTLVRGLVNRKVESNNVNEDSSRSHAIFTVLMEACARDDAELEADEADSFTSKITFVDLAGSERLSKTKSEGDRRKEGININKGLLELGRVRIIIFNVLADSQNHNGLTFQHTGTETPRSRWFFRTRWVETPERCLLLAFLPQTNIPVRRRVRWVMRTT